mmetsp:Transcript_68199/g.181468  ORF Transcript_68199/g.181468 Transcript_68199/m.181468 type:complete len:229 (-) Transcript_68199:876-1562(-)
MTLWYSTLPSSRTCASAKPVAVGVLAPCSCSRPTTCGEGKWPQFAASISRNLPCNVLSSCRLFSAPSCSMTFSLAQCEALVPSSPPTVVLGKSASASDSNHSCSRACGALSLTCLSLCVIWTISSRSRGRPPGKRSQGILTSFVASAIFFVSFDTCKTPRTELSSRGTCPIISWKKVIPILNMSPRGYQQPNSCVSGGIYPGVPLAPVFVVEKAAARPKSMSTMRGSA